MIFYWLQYHHNQNLSCDYLLFHWCPNNSTNLQEWVLRAALIPNYSNERDLFYQWNASYLNCFLTKHFPHLFTDELCVIRFIKILGRCDFPSCCRNLHILDSRLNSHLSIKKIHSLYASFVQLHHGLIKWYGYKQKFVPCISFVLSVFWTYVLADVFSFHVKWNCKDFHVHLLIHRKTHCFM